MNTGFHSSEDIEKQLGHTARQIELFKEEVLSEDLERYPNFEERLTQLIESIGYAEDALLAVADFGVSSSQLNELTEVVSDAGSVVAKKIEETSINTLVIALNSLKNLQSALQELIVGDDSAHRENFEKEQSGG
jgi:hypothetical protein